jgi:glycosyltransferase involved in cell wall biosynthesis
MLGGPTYSFTAHGPEEFDRVIALHLRDKVHHSAFAVCISSYGRSQMWRWIDFEDWPKVKVVHCGVDEHFLATGDPPPVPDSRDLVCVGRLVGQKGQLVLAEAARRLRDAGERFCIHLLGDGPLREEIEAFIREHGLEAHIRLHGFASGADVRRRILEARATVLPSFAEGLPVAIMESLALGRPCITTYVAGIPELVEPGRTGWLVPAGDADALTAAMKEVLKTSPEDLTQIGRRGVQRVRERHDVAEEARRLQRFFREAGGKREVGGSDSLTPPER